MTAIPLKYVTGKETRPAPKIAWTDVRKVKECVPSFYGGICFTALFTQPHVLTVAMDVGFEKIWGGRVCLMFREIFYTASFAKLKGKKTTEGAPPGDDDKDNRIQVASTSIQASSNKAIVTHQY